ncbi:HPP family-domain-containing protein [Cyathus striatus]|nr:HPP family-domain-containing protein [Cyathus striatus]
MPPQSRLAKVLQWISRWLGYRPSPPPKRSNYIVWFWSSIGAFCDISLIQAVFGQAHYGASAVLMYGAIEAPLSQPRALFGGHFIGALIGICITKLFHLLPTDERFAQLEWLAGSISCAGTIVLMQITETMHPPGGATALLAAVNAEVRDMGCYYLPVVLLTSTLALVVALLVNNIQRRYPLFWFQPAVPAAVKPPPPTAQPQPQTQTEAKQDSQPSTVNGSLNKKVATAV